MWWRRPPPPPHPHPTLLPTGCLHASPHPHPAPAPALLLQCTDKLCGMCAYNAEKCNGCAGDDWTQTYPYLDLKGGSLLLPSSCQLPCGL